MATRHSTRFVDLTGQTFGRLTVLRCGRKNKHGNYTWHCRCECGNESIVISGNLRRGNTLSCGCLFREGTSARCLIDLAGKTFGRLTVIQRAANRGKEKTRWLCRCECGKDKIVTASNLTSGNSTSCGCKSIESLRERSVTHGKTELRIYGIWLNMKNRCNNKKYHLFKDYGGRGIKVCERWNQFENFYADMGDPPEGRVLDRIDNNGNYEPANCRWATWKQQNLNKRNTVYVEVEGERLTIPEWAGRLKISKNALYIRRRRTGSIF